MLIKSAFFSGGSIIILCWGERKLLRLCFSGICLDGGQHTSQFLEEWQSKSHNTPTCVMRLYHSIMLLCSKSATTESGNCQGQDAGACSVEDSEVHCHAIGVSHCHSWWPNRGNITWFNAAIARALVRRSWLEANKQSLPRVEKPFKIRWLDA